MMEAVVDELMCPICLELFTVPIILPCSHILCKSPCAERLFNHGFVRCPVCRDNSFVSGGLDCLPRVISLEHIIDRYNAGPLVPANDLCSSDEHVACQMCQGQPRRAKKSCLDCNASYCQQCLRLSHPAKAPFTEHNLVDPRKYPKPREEKCEQHDMTVNIYCRDCMDLGCLLCADAAHPGHQILNLQQATQTFQGMLEEQMQQLEKCQEQVGIAVRAYQEKAVEFQSKVEERRSHIGDECDSLIAEIELKREFFLSDLEYEEKSKSSALQAQVKIVQDKGLETQSLIHYAKEVSRESTEPCVYLQLAKSLLERIQKNVSSPVEMPPGEAPILQLNHKVVDFRKEKAFLKEMNYLTPPCTPVIDVPKCSRSSSSVVIVLAPPENETDVIDGYYVYYCSTEQPDASDQIKMVFKNSKEERKYGRANNSSAVCLIHNNLDSNTMYYFCVRAFNLAGESNMSEIVNCRTRSGSQTSIPEPQISERMCRTYTHSIQIYSNAPVNSEPDSDISHFLLYRESAADKIWKSVSMYGRLDHRVFGLQSDTMYDFVVMATSKNGECQVSNSVTLRSEQAAY